MEVVHLLSAGFQSINMFAQHYSGRHVTDDNYGSSSGSGFVILLLLVVVGFVIYAFIRGNQNKSGNYSSNNESNAQPQSDNNRYKNDYFIRIIEENKRRQKESDESFKGCIWGLIIIGLFVLGYIIHNN